MWYMMKIMVFLRCRGAYEMCNGMYSWKPRKHGSGNSLPVKYWQQTPGHETLMNGLWYEYTGSVRSQMHRVCLSLRYD